MITFAKRIRIISIFFVLVALLLISRLYTIQILNHDKYVDIGDRQYIKKNSNMHDRGDIYFTKKDGTHVVAATMRDEYTLYINPKSFYTFLKSYKNTTSKTEDQLLSEVTSSLINSLKIESEKKEDLNTKIQKIKDKKNDTSLELLKELSYEEQNIIKDLKFDFLSLGVEKKRYYPGNSLASNVIGVLGFQGNQIAGRYGLEKYFEDTLSRNNKVYNNFFVDLFSGAKKIISDRDKLEGDIYTTIEPIVQKELEKKILQVNDKQNSDLTGAIIMNPYTGEIIAMAKVPTFSHDNKKYDISSYKNDMVENSYEMGSIIKPLTMAVGVDLGKVDSEFTYKDNGFVKVRDRTIYNFDKKARGNINMQTAFSQSLNTAFVYISTLVGNENLTKYFTSFGMRDKTGIDLPNESSPLTNNLDKGDVEHATISFGQGIAMSPIGTIRSLSVIANSGYIVKPHVVNKIKYKIGNTFEIKNATEEENKKILLKNETIDEVKSMMVYNVDNVLLNGSRKNARHSIAAKTGTAQIASESGGYIDGKNMHTFIGFFPAYKPEFIILLYTIDPKSSRYASESLATPFMDLTDFLIQYYEIQPDR